MERCDDSIIDVCLRSGSYFWLLRVLVRCALKELRLSLLLSALDAVYSFRTYVWLRVQCPATQLSSAALASGLVPIVSGRAQRVQLLRFRPSVALCAGVRLRCFLLSILWAFALAILVVGSR